MISKEKTPNGINDAIAEEEGTTEVLEASNSAASTEELLGLGAPTTWKASTSSSSKLTYWKLDEHPTPQDGQRRALDFLGTARAVAERVSREEVDREVAKMTE